MVDPPARDRPKTRFVIVFKLYILPMGGASYVFVFWETRKQFSSEPGDIGVPGLPTDFEFIGGGLSAVFVHGSAQCCFQLRTALTTTNALKYDPEGFGSSSVPMAIKFAFDYSQGSRNVANFHA